MEKFSLIVFSRNDSEKVIECIRALYDLADEVVLVDSSNKEQRDRLAEEKKKNSFDKLKIYYTIPLGYPDPVRMYGLQKCRNEWVLLLDADERLSQQMKSDLPKLLGKSCDAYAIRRINEWLEKSDKIDGFTWQIRLFRKNKIEYRGLRHEQAIVRRRLDNLDPRYYIYHISHKITTSMESQKLAPYDERLSYKLYNERYLEYFGKFFVPSKGMKDTMAGKILLSLLHIYEKITLKSQDQEVSLFDYFVFNSLKDLGYTLKGRSAIRFLDDLRFQYKHIDVIRGWKSAENSKMAFEISCAINEIGITKYLGLDNEERIMELNRRFKDKKGGITLLVELLEERYMELRSRSKESKRSIK